MTLRVEQVDGRPWQWRVTLCWSGGVCDGLEVAVLVEEVDSLLVVCWPSEVTWANPAQQARVEHDICSAVRQAMRERGAR